MTIGGEDRLASGEGRNQHEQAGLGQMEVGEQGVDEAEVEAGRDEDLRFTGVGPKWSLARVASGLERAMFESADDRGADGDDAASSGGGAIDGIGG